MLSLLGGIKTAQKSINTKEYYTEIINYFYDQKIKIQSLMNKSANEHTQKLWKHFLENKKFNFPINFHIYTYLFYTKYPLHFLSKNFSI